MNVELINPFVEAANTVASMLFGQAPQLGQVYIKSTPYATEHVVIMIGVTGKLKGQVALSLSIEAGKSLASAMMGGMEVTHFDELAKSAIGELGNMIMGNATTLFAERGIAIDITPPSIVTGSNLTISNKLRNIAVPLTIGDLGKMEICIAAETQ